MQPFAKQRFVGLMSGTSADGIDAVVAEISGRDRGLKAKLLSHTHHGFSSSLRKKILHICLHGKVDEVCELNFELGEHFAQATLAAIRKAQLKPAQITAIGSHGQTIHYLPHAKHPSTLQIGEPCVIAERTGILTVADFRVRDMAAGGLGAPLVPFTDWALLSDDTNWRLVQNIGGIGNVTVLPPRAQLADVRAFDTGPGNMVIDAVVSNLSSGRKTFDKNGAWAAKGHVSGRLLAECMAHPYFRRKPPKTTGREEFGEAFVRRFLVRAKHFRLPDADIVATATALTAETIADAYRRFVFPKLRHGRPKRLVVIEVILGGGGARNVTLRKMLETGIMRDIGNMTGFGIETHEKFHIPSSAKEPLAFAIMAYETLHRRPSNVPSVSGARQAVILGKIVPA